MTTRDKGRKMARALALAAGYFWLPCPICGEEFGGNEWREVHGHRSSIPNPDTIDCNPVMSTGICQGCTAKGIGCCTAGRLMRLDRPTRHDCEEFRRGVRERGEA